MLACTRTYRPSSNSQRIPSRCLNSRPDMPHLQLNTSLHCICSSIHHLVIALERLSSPISESAQTLGSATAQTSLHICTERSLCSTFHARGHRQQCQQDSCKIPQEWKLGERESSSAIPENLQTGHGPLHRRTLSPAPTFPSYRTTGNKPPVCCNKAADV